jgi:hypothetical protein
MVTYLSSKKSNGAAKHIDSNFHIMKDRIHDDTVILMLNIYTRLMLADPLVKAYYLLYSIHLLPAWVCTEPQC